MEQSSSNDSSTNQNTSKTKSLPILRETSFISSNEIAVSSAVIKKLLKSHPQRTSILRSAMPFSAMQSPLRKRSSTAMQGQQSFSSIIMDDTTLLRSIPVFKSNTPLQ